LQTPEAPGPAGALRAFGVSPAGLDGARLGVPAIRRQARPMPWADSSKDARRHRTP